MNVWNWRKTKTRSVELSLSVAVPYAQDKSGRKREGSSGWWEGKVNRKKRRSDEKERDIWGYEQSPNQEQKEFLLPIAYPIRCKRGAQKSGAREGEKELKNKTMRGKMEKGEGEQTQGKADTKPEHFLGGKKSPPDSSNAKIKSRFASERTTGRGKSRRLNHNVVHKMHCKNSPGTGCAPILCGGRECTNNGERSSVKRRIRIHEEFEPYRVKRKNRNVKNGGEMS